MKRSILLLSLSLIYLVSIISLSAQNDAATPTVKIGMILPLTGNEAYYGENVRDTITLWQEQHPDHLFKYQFIFEDDQSDPKQTAVAVNKLIHVDRVDVIQTIFAGPGNVVAPLAERNKIVHFALSWDPNTAKGLYNFECCHQPREYIDVLLQKLQKERIKSVGIFHLNQSGYNACAKELEERLKGLGITVGYNDSFNIGERDFRTLIAKAKENPVQMAVILTFPPELDILLAQLKEMNYPATLTSIEDFEWVANKKLVEGLWYVSPLLPGSKYSRDFEARFHRSAAYPGYAYDIMNLLVKAYEEDPMKKPTTEEVANRLLKIQNFPGVSGPLNVDSEGIVRMTPHLAVIKNGMPSLLSE